MSHFRHFNLHLDLHTDSGNRFVLYYLSAIIQCAQSVSLLHNHFEGINPGVKENIKITVILISVEMDGVTVAVSPGNILLFKNNRLCLYIGV